MSQKAQQTIEYSVILGLIAAGIIIMGPYVIRSWNANVKGKEEAVLDSISDPLLEDPEPKIDLPSCDCSDWEGTVPDDCGIDPCKETELKETRTNCQPPGCEAEHPEYKYGRCKPNSGCCTVPAPYARQAEYCSLNLCNNIEGKFEALEPDLRAIWISQLKAFCDAHIRSEDGEHGCPDKEILYFSVCGDEPAPNFSCEKDEVCDFRCEPEDVDPTTSIKCIDTGDDPLDEEGLSEITERTYVSTCTQNRKCEAKCCPGFCVGEVPEDSRSCSDGTLPGTCSNNKPLYCTDEGKLVEDCNTHCNCEAGLTCLSSGKCGCPDGTPDLECSPQKPKFCWGGELVDYCTECYCNSPATCNPITEKCE